MKLKRLLLSALALSLLVGLGGLYSHASAEPGANYPSHKKIKTGTLKVKVYYQNQRCIAKQTAAEGPGFGVLCKPILERYAHILISSSSPNAVCAGIDVSSSHDFGNRRNFKCTPGTYNITTDKPDDVVYSRPKSNVTITYIKSDVVIIASKKTATSKIGTQSH